MKRYLYAWLVIGLALLMGACTSKNGERLQNAVPADVTSVVFLDKSFVNELAEVSDDDTFFSKGGINGVGLFTLGTLTDEVIVMDVESVGAVRDYFLAKNYKVVNAASELYSDPEGKKFIIISSQNKCVYLGSPRNASEQSVFGDLGETSARKPFANSVFSPCLDYTSEITGMATADFVTSLAPVLPRVSTGGALVINGATDGPRLAGEMLFVNAKGEKISFDTALPFTFDTNAIISEKALALLGPNVNIVGAVALKNVEWEKVFKSLGSSSAVSFKDKATIAMIRPFLEQTDGTLAVGVGTTLMPGQSLTSLAFDPSALVVSVVVEMKKDEPSKLLQRLKGFASMVGLTASDTAEGFSVTLPDEGITVNARATETALLISTMEINAGGNVSPTMSAINFGGYIAAFGAVIDADSPLQQMFDKGPRQDLTFTLGADMPSSTVSFEIVCGKEGDWVKNMKPYFNQK